MLYKPSTGRFKDNVVFWKDDRFYLFSMYTEVPGDTYDSRYYSKVWQAVSEDGVHWNDVGPIITAPFIVYAMNVWQAGDRFYLNHGSFTTLYPDSPEPRGSSDKQNVLRFWESADLRNWNYMGEEFDVYPDSRYYDPDSRLDCMDVISLEEEGRTAFYGIASGPGGWLRSEDGIRWEGLPAPKFEWGRFRPPGEVPFEWSGWQQIGGKFYAFGGHSGYAGNIGYCVFTVVGESVRGPFRPDLLAYRLSGNSDRSVHIWARPCRAGGDLLFSSYMYDGYGYTEGNAWLPPLKKGIVDDDGHLRLAYWEGNESIKDQEIEVDMAKFERVLGKSGPSNVQDSSEEDFEIALSSNRLEVKSRREIARLLHQVDDPNLARVSPSSWRVPSAVLVLDQPLPFECGLVFEATFRIGSTGSESGPGIGLFLEESPGSGTSIMLMTYGITEIGHLDLNHERRFNREDLIGAGCASVAGVEVNTAHRLTLLIRGNIFELYVDGMYAQTFNTSHLPGSIGSTPRRLGIIVQNGHAVIEDIKAWEMNL